MTVDPSISLAIIQKELKECEGDRLRFGWCFSDIQIEVQTFTVTMSSLVDQQKYVIEMKFDNYKEDPLFIEFLDPENGERGIKRAYPKYDDSFFNEGQTCICHPCSRKAYVTGLHGDWKMSGWRENSKVGSLTTIDAILRALQSRINDREHYRGRMG